MKVLRGKIPAAGQETPSRVAATPLYWVATSCYVALTALLFAWLVWLDPPPASLRSPLLLVLLLPLLLGLRGILHRRRYTLQWTGMLILLYFMHGLLATTGAAPQRWLGVAEILLTLGYFVAGTVILRRGKQRHKADQSKA
ncbi:hypothetical protein SPICUR_02620 [Spiribacter curvatus]|uniref:DUF2069 domain-containing protein n=1 Tax=Spiribacter curvatus TaxID=1335757 RepID=U5T281_9GAMM|nr:DUF2069 domain-containing protein [Spiribacter curvatus]AGY91535.1 hypothetical protein SPICUR_02620 [Spiribacter curvatus]